jgi:hypothetical protein
MLSAYINVSWGIAWSNIRYTTPHKSEEGLLQTENVMQEVINYQSDWENNVLKLKTTKN